MERKLLWITVLVLVLALFSAAAGDGAEPVSFEIPAEEYTEDTPINTGRAVEQYILQAFGLRETTRFYSRPLSGANAVVYDAIARLAHTVTAGEQSSTICTVPIASLVTKISYTAAELGLSSLDDTNAATNAFFSKVKEEANLQISTIMQKLKNEYPCEMFWYGNKNSTKYPSCWIGSGNVYFDDDACCTFSLFVSADYSVTGAENTTDYNTSYSNQVKTAAANAQAIVNANKGKSNYQKLLAYKNAICDRVKYNDEAAADKEMPYGDPWQVISVFDDDKTTNVVCEGYAKAFKYLCDMSSFNSPVTVSLVSGDTSGPHMWNLVEIRGINYLVDVTNCDSGFDLFMVGYYDSYQSGDRWGYIYRSKGTDIKYLYRTEMTNLYYDEELQVNPSDYDFLTAATVTFDANGGEGTMEAQTMATETATALNPNTFTRPYYEFMGWNIAKDGSGTAIADGETLTLSDHTTLYAQWEALAKEPVIRTEPSSVTIAYGYTSGNVLTVETEEIEDQTNSYQWYSSPDGTAGNGTALEGETGSSRTVPEGWTAGTTKYYFCVVTAERVDTHRTASTVSKAATVSVIKADPAYTLPDSLVAVYGQTLSDVTLPKGWSWPDAGLSVGNAGTNAFKATFTPDDVNNYNILEGLDVSVAVSKADPVYTAPVAGNGLVYTRKAQDLVSAGATEHGTITYSTALDGAYTSAVPQGTNAGTYEVWWKLTGDANHNDILPTRISGITIAQRPVTVSGLAAKEKVYDGTKNAELDTSAAVVSNLVEGDALTVSGTAAFEDADAGEEKMVQITGITLGGESAGNYVLTEQTAAAKAKITPQPLTVSAKDHSITYGDVPSNDGVLYTGFVSGESESVLSGKLEFACTYAQYGDVGTDYQIMPSGLQSGNYTISYTAGKLCVEKKTVGLSWEGTDRIYDGTEQLPAATVTGLVNSDSVSAEISGGQTDAGSYTATVTGLSGEKSGNYQLPQETAVSYVIAKADPDVPLPSAPEAYYGQALSDLTLSDGWTWTDAALSVGSAGNHTFSAVYIPADPKNYNQLTAEIDVTVLKALPPELTDQQKPKATKGLRASGTSLKLAVAPESIPEGYKIQYALGKNLLDAPENGWAASVPAAADVGDYALWYRYTGDENHQDIEASSFRTAIYPEYGTPDFRLPAKTKKISESAFEGSLMTVVDLPDSCASIGAYAFRDCGKLSQIRIPAGCEIGTGAFDGCKKVYIYSAAGSPAEAYCDSHDNCVFVSMDEEN